MAKTLFITGTDTDAGKTYFSVALLKALKNGGYKSSALKPVAAGCDEHGHNDDALQLQQAMTADLPYQQVNPVALQDPIAPHIAAAEEGKRVTASRLEGFARGLCTRKEDICLIEGAGGWLCPLNEKETLADFAKLMQTPVIIVVGLKLGCLNHALLTAQSVRASGLPIVGWVANCVSETMPVRDQNIEYLSRSMGAPCLAMLPHGLTTDEAAQRIQLDFIEKL